MPWFTKKERRMQVSDFPAIFKADFGRFRHISAVFRPVSAVSAASRYDLIWPIRPDFGRISSIRCKSKLLRHESSRIGANWAESARIREKKKKRRRGLTRGQPHWTPRLVSRRVGRGCGTSGAASMLSSQHHDHHKRIRSGEPRALSGPATSVRTNRLSSQSHSELTTEELVAKSIAPINKHFLRPLLFRPSSNDAVSQTTTTASAAIAPSQSSFVKYKKSKRQLKCEIQIFFFSLTLNFLREQTKIIYIISL